MRFVHPVLAREIVFVPSPQHRPTISLLGSFNSAKTRSNQVGNVTNCERLSPCGKSNQTNMLVSCAVQHQNTHSTPSTLALSHIRFNLLFLFRCPASLLGIVYIRVAPVIKTYNNAGEPAIIRCCMLIIPKPGNMCNPNPQHPLRIPFRSLREQPEMQPFQGGRHSTYTTAVDARGA